MSSDKKEKATRYQETNKIDRQTRPVYHVTPPTGWMNDPNGFSIYKGKIHLFYQYHPYKDIWGPMHWGHCTTEDYLTWDDLPVALAPDEEYDASGCFSGSAIDVDGNQVLIYTGAAKRPPGVSTRLAAQQQCTATGDGMDYVKSPYNPVIPTDALPAQYRPTEFRDPKIWKYEDAYWLVAVAMDEHGLGHVLIYTSEDLKTWRYVSVAASSNGTYGEMWECPDLFRLDNRDVLVVSCMRMKDSGRGYHDGFGVICLIGDMDWQSGTLNNYTVYPLDQGADFYAPQTLKTDDGRRIMIAWMQAWENFIKPNDQKWHGMMTVPRELTIRNGTIVQTPVRELDSAHTGKVEVNDVRIAGPDPVEIPQIRGRVIDMTIEMTDVDCRDFTIEFAPSQETGIQFTWSVEENAIVCERKVWGVSMHVTDAFEKQTIALPEETGAPKLRFLVDTASVELFVDDGTTVFSATYYAPAEVDSIRFSANGTVGMNVLKYDIDPQAALKPAERTGE